MYDFGVYKGNSRAIICGENWCRFVEDFDLREGDLVSFDLTEDIPNGVLLQPAKDMR